MLTTENVEFWNWSGIRWGLVLSSATLAIPAFVSWRKQPPVYAVILGTAAFFSFMYHLTAEDQFEAADQDVNWANIVIVVMELHLLINFYNFYFRPLGGKRDWDGMVKYVILPVMFALAGAGLFMFGGRMTEGGKRPSTYNVFHISWHVLTSLAALFIVCAPVDNWGHMLTRPWGKIYPKQPARDSRETEMYSRVDSDLV
jgi:hypothetical protein